MWKKAILVVVGIISLLSAFPLLQTIGDGSQTTTLSVEPQGTFGLAPGNTFSINITVSNVTDLYAYEFKLYYQSAVLNASTRFNINLGIWVPDIDPGPFLPTIGGNAPLFSIVSFTDNYNATHGLIYIGSSMLGNVAGVDGTGTLATIRFKAIGSGGSILHLDETGLLDSVKPFGNHIPHTPIDGQAYVGSVDVALSEIDTPIIIPKGSVAYVNVTAQNRGQITETFDVTLYGDADPIETKTVVNLPAGNSTMLDFTWNTMLLPIGEYNLTATATTVPGETDTSDNTLSLKVYLTTFLTTLKKVVGQGFSTHIDVTVTNQGAQPETSNITAFGNRTIIATFNNITLTSGNSTTITLTWNTTSFAYGNYTISAYTWPVPFEMNTTNNNLTTSWVMVTLVGDLTGGTSSPWDFVPDGKCDGKDIAIVAKCFGSAPGAQPPEIWNPNCDVNDDGKVDGKDIALVARNFGMRAP